MCAGVGKSGSPAPKPITFSPAAFSALAFAVTARVGDSLMAWMRADRDTGGPLRQRADGEGIGHRAYGVEVLDLQRRRLPSDTEPVSPPPPEVPSWPIPPTSPSPPTCCPPTGGSGAARPRSPRPPSTPLAMTGRELLGTSHRKARVKDQVARLRRGMAELFSLPDGYEVVLAPGGATAFWEMAAFGMVQQRARHYVFGEFSSKFAKATAKAPWLDDPDVGRGAGRHPPRRSSPVRRRRRAGADAQRDLDRRDDGRRPPRRRRAWCSSTPPPAPGGCRSTRPRSTPTTSACRRASPPRAGSPSRCCPRPRSSVSRPSRPPTATSRPFFDLTTAIDNSPQGPDLQHPGDRHGVPGRRDGRLDERRGWPRRHGRARPRQGRPPVRLGRAARLGQPRSSPTRTPGRWWWAPSTSTTPSPPTTSTPPCAPTASSTPTPTASSAATSCASACSPTVDLSDLQAYTACVDHVVEQLGA